MYSQPEEDIRVRAYHIWEKEGCPEGRAEANWKQASEELDAAADNRFTGGPDDLERDPGIETSAGTSVQDHDLVSGDSTVEGDTLEDATPAGGIDPLQRGRTNG